MNAVVVLRQSLVLSIVGALGCSPLNSRSTDSCCIRAHLNAPLEAHGARALTIFDTRAYI